MNGFFSRIRQLSSYANYDFYKLSSEITALIAEGHKHNLYDPKTCSVTIAKTENGKEFSITMELYYNNLGQITKLPKTFIVGRFNTIPKHLYDEICSVGSCEMVINYLDEVLSLSTESVQPAVSFNEIIRYKAEVPSTQRKITITDELFFYRVRYSLTKQTGESSEHVVNYVDIKDMPMDIALKLKNDTFCAINFESNK